MRITTSDLKSVAGYVSGQEFHLRIHFSSARLKPILEIPQSFLSVDQWMAFACVSTKRIISHPANYVNHLSKMILHNQATIYAIS